MINFKNAKKKKALQAIWDLLCTQILPKPNIWQSSEAPGRLTPNDLLKIQEQTKVGCYI